MQYTADFSADLYSRIVSDLPSGVIVIAFSGEIILFNQESERLLGLKADDVGKQFCDIFSTHMDEGSFGMTVSDAVKKRSTAYGLSADYINNGKKNKLTLSTSIINADGQEVLSVLIQDATENDAKNRFLSNMSHEFRTPINAILGMNEMILRECHDEQIRTYAEYIQSSGKSLLFLMNDLLDMAKIESGNFELNPAEYETADFLMELWNIVYIRANAKNIRLSFATDNSMPKTLFGDVDRIKQIAANIMLTAISHSTKDGEELSISCRQIDDDNVELIISVKDTGGELFFDNFNTQSDDSSYGLDISMSLVKLMGGNIYITTGSSNELIFTAYVPQKIIDASYIDDFETLRMRSSYSPDVQRMAPCFKNANVLVVDDNHMNITVFKSLLKDTGINITSADSGSACLEIAKQTHFDIIFMDHMMPVMDGIETMQHIKDMPDGPNYTVPVIALTANAISGSREFYLGMGFSDFLAKPIDSKQLEEMIIKYLPEECVEFVYPSPDMKPADDVQEADMDSYGSYEQYGISIADGLEYSGSSMDVYLELMGMFLNDTAKQEKLEQLIVDYNMKNYGIEVHALKGNARMLGANTLADIAFEHEKQSKAGNAEYVEEHWDELVSAWNTTLEGFDLFYHSQCGDAADGEADDALPEGECIEISADDMAKVAELIGNFQTSEAVTQLKDWLKSPLEQDVRSRLKEALAALEQEYDEDKAMDILNGEKK